MHDYYIEFESHPLGPGYTVILQSEEGFDFMSDAVKFLETHGWYFDCSRKSWQHSTGFTDARIRPISEKHAEGVFQNKRTGEKRNYGPVKLLD